MKKLKIIFFIFIFIFKILEANFFKAGEKTSSKLNFALSYVLLSPAVLWPVIVPPVIKIIIFLGINLHR